MRRVFAGVVGAIASVSLVINVGAITIDFDELVGNNNTQIADYVNGDVTFTAEALGPTTLSIWGPPYTTGGKAIAGGVLGAYLPVRATIAGGATSVSVLLGDGFIDNDSDVVLSAYAADDTFLGSDSATLSTSLGYLTVSVSGVTPPPIAYVIWGNTASGVSADSVLADEFRYTAVPEAGATLAFLGLALCAISAVRRRVG